MWNVVGEDGDVHQKFSKPEGPDVLPPHLNYHPDHPSVSFSYDHKLNPAVVSNSVVALNPTLRSCVQNFGKFEFGCIAITTIAGAVTSFRNKRCLYTLSFTGYSLVGLIAGFTCALYSSRRTR